MKKSIIFLIVMNLFFTNCKRQISEDIIENEETKNEVVVNPVSEILKLNAFLKKFEINSQIFKVASNKKCIVKIN